MPTAKPLKILITGAGGGIGKMAALKLAKQGHRILLVTRDTANGESLLQELSKLSGNHYLRNYAADLSRPKEVQRLGNRISDQEQSLDVLINNAGVYMPAKEFQGEIETTFAVNHLAYFLLSNSLLPILKKSGQARIINVTSATHAKTLDWNNLQGEKKYTGLDAYRRSKLLNILFTYEMSKRLIGTNITCNCLHPGLIATGIYRNSFSWVSVFSRFFLKDASWGAEPLFYAATATALSKVSGKYFHRFKMMDSTPYSYNVEAARKLWDYSEKITNQGF